MLRKVKITLNFDSFLQIPPPAKKSKIDPNSEPSFEVLDDLSKEITTVWDSVGRQLGLEEATIECIEENNVQHARPNRKAYEMIKSWKQKGTSVTYKELGRVLKHLGNQILAEKYCGNV